MLHFIFANWYWLFWGSLALVAIIAARMVGGDRLALVVAALVAAIGFYKKGEKDGAVKIRDKAKKEVADALGKGSKARSAANADNADSGSVLKSDGFRRD